MNALARFRSDDALQGIEEGMSTQASDMMVVRNEALRYISLRSKREE